MRHIKKQDQEKEGDSRIYPHVAQLLIISHIA